MLIQKLGQYELSQLDEFTYNLKIYKNNKILYKVIKKILHTTIYDEDTDSIFFSADKVNSLQQFLFNIHNSKIPQNIWLTMIDELTKQILYLKQKSYGFFGFNISDILVINGNTFIYCSGENLLKLAQDNFIFYSPIDLPYFGNPELYELTKLPHNINYKCSFYSLGVLFIFCFLNEYLLVGNVIKSQEEIETILTPIKNTKIYWFLKRCVHPFIHKRSLLLI